MWPWDREGLGGPGSHLIIHLVIWSSWTFPTFTGPKLSSMNTHCTHNPQSWKLRQEPWIIKYKPALNTTKGKLSKRIMWLGGASWPRGVSRRAWIFSHNAPGLSGRAGVSWATLLAAERVTVRRASLFPSVRRTCKISGQSGLHTKLMLFPFPLLKSTRTPKPHWSTII